LKIFNPYWSLVEFRWWGIKRQKIGFVISSINSNFSLNSQNMKVYKFGGASVKDADGIRNLSEIVSEERGNLVVVVSAFGKTTNALEKVLKAWLNKDEGYSAILGEIHNTHISVTKGLFGDNTEVKGKIDVSFALLRNHLLSEVTGNYDFEYDQIVSYGEVWSTIIVAEYLKTKNPETKWIDIREILLTDDRYRDANVMWNESAKKAKTAFSFSDPGIYVTQGFIGGTVAGNITTLGREGSDYTAAILANMLDAECVVVWKDVEGILNADPKWLSNARKMEEISYKEAVEMSFSGAKVIHPKTIKPLHNKCIPLYVKSFLKPKGTGTVIKSDAMLKEVMPIFIKKEDQILISITPKDFSFVMGDNLSRIFHTFITRGIKVNLVEASAVSIDVCIDDERMKVDILLNDLKSEFAIVYNENIELLAVRHFTHEAIQSVTKDREILLEQRTRSTVRFVVRKT
jgi:aspartate kinase